LPSRFWASLAGLAAAATAVTLAACSNGPAPSSDARLTVYVSAPLHGPSAADGRDVLDGAKLALADAGGRSVGIPVKGVYLDDSARERGWGQAQTAVNARRAAQDSTTIAYLGELDSGATRVSEPITNEAGILQVSPGAAAVDLVQPFPGSTRVPEDTQPSGDRTFGRVIPDDEAQAQAAAVWAKRLGSRHVMTDEYPGPFSAEMTVGFTEEARELGLQVNAMKAGVADGDLVYATPPPAHAHDFQRVVRALPRAMTTDALLESGLVAGKPRSRHQLYATSSAQDPAQLPAAARTFLHTFERRYQRPPGRYAAYGYEAMAVVLHSIAAADDPLDRESVVDAFFSTTNRDSILGSYSIDEVGDTTLDRLAGYRLTGGRPQPVAVLRVP
jgi:branched-chain amino acid transport system substrate-binding protein